MNQARASAAAPQTSTRAMSTQRLQKELKLLARSPLENMRTAPNPNDILEFHYVHFGHKGTPYEGGVYHGKLVFPKEYPFKPPSVIMMTPNGRFEPGKRICLSMSDFHPESWNPMWSVSSILTGLESFFYETTRTAGSVESSMAQKVAYARASMAVNIKSVMFRKLFNDIIVDWREKGGGEDAAAASVAVAEANANAAPAVTWRHLVVVFIVLLLAFFNA